eukprot:TRINITY_DN9225_c0_g1_i1.p1 TRINITY_DN9225_c0_g1~~TRINITY_DN9225_c0_g1_i1.p1  ORF type:complete len:255 (+),score=69.03 TRINITY_DN9225_c0_g1_i1:26-766(+)
MAQEEVSAADVKENLARVAKTVRETPSAWAREHGGEVRLVAVSKFKPEELIRAAYECGQRYFGENYVQELVKKAKSLSALEGIKWHFIGHLQANKVNNLLSAPNLDCVETVDSIALALKLDNAWAKQTHAEPLKIMIQVNTSGEPNKSGLALGQVVPVVQEVCAKCQHLKLVGLMTIGEQEQSERDFTCLAECKEKLCAVTFPGLNPRDLELSMGMSGDFENAIQMGSANVRVGSHIFGARARNTQ